MPTYDYLCQGCGYSFEKFQSITEKVMRKCPECGKNRLRRLIGSGAGVIFKGNGFYQTDYRSESYKNAAKADKEKSTPAKSKSETTQSAGGDKKAAKSQTSD